MLLTQVEGQPAAMVALARLMRTQGDKALSVKLCTRALDLAPDDGEVRAIAAEVLSAGVPQWHFNIVRDTGRNEAYEAALRRAVFPGCKVLEIGTGTGLLAMMAARAGAAEVITCESDCGVAMAAQDIVARNGYADRIRVIAKHSTAVDVRNDLGGPADILVSEIISDDLLSEGTLPACEHAIRHLIKPGAQVIPVRGFVRVALADDDDWERSRMDHVVGFDLGVFNRLAAPQRQFDIGTGRFTLRSEPANLFTFDFASGGPFSKGSAAVTLTAQSRRINGIAQWIALDMDGEGRYENRPEPGANSSWSALFYPFERPLDVKPGDAVAVHGRHNRSALRIWADAAR